MQFQVQGPPVTVTQGIDVKIVRGHTDKHRRHPLSRIEKHMSAQPKFVHESFDREKTGGPSARPHVIRQDRVIAPPERCFCLFDGVRCEVLNYSPFGVAVSANSQRLDKSEFSDVEIQYDGITIGRYHLRFVREQLLSQEERSSVFEVIGEPIDTAKIQAVEGASHLLARLEANIAEDSQISEGIKKIVLDIKDLLETFRTECNALEEKLNWESPDIQHLLDEIAKIVGASLSKAFSGVYSDLQKELKAVGTSNMQKSLEYFRTKLRPLIYRSPLADRAYRKPSGYAGDFQMMNMMYDLSNGGKDLFSKCIHQHFNQDPAARAVRNRSVYLRDKISRVLRDNKHAKILSVACGPAKELQLVFENEDVGLLSSAEFHLLDQDERALHDAQRRLGLLSRRRTFTPVVAFHNLAIKNIIARGIPQSGFTLIYSAGLFDYFTDPVARMAAERLYASLASGGELIIGNFNVTNPSRAVMELVLDWELIYRTGDDLKALFGSLGGSVRIEEESESINLFCVIKKP